MKYFVSILLFLLSLNIFSQKGYLPGYVITNDFDTLRGVIKMKTNFQNSRLCEFTDKSDNVAKRFTPDDIRGFRIDYSKYYLSKEVEIDGKKEKLFIEYLVDGIVDLYYLKEPEREYYFVEKNNVLTLLTNEEMKVKVVTNEGEVNEKAKEYTKNTNRYQGILRYMFQDSPGITNEINRTNFDYKPLIKLAVDYHNSICKDQTCIDYTKSTRSTIFLEPQLGFLYSTMILKTSDQKAVNASPSFGLNLRIGSMKGFTKWALRTGINVSGNKFKGDYYNRLFLPYYAPDDRLYRINIRYIAVRIPFELERAFTNNKLQPTLSLGYTNVFLLGSDYSILEINDEYNSDVFSRLRKYQYGFNAGIGFKYTYNKNSYYYLRGGYEFRLPSALLNHVLDFHKVYSFTITTGIAFKLK